MNVIPLLLIAATLITACGSTPPAPSATQDAPADTRAAHVAPLPAQTASRQVSELDDPNSPLAKRSLYFPYDNFTVDGKYDDLLRAHADFLGRHPEARMTIEGNADERGSHEYNLALGQKRAEAVRQVLRLTGVAEQQLEAISYGKERPKASCPEERCWSQNRRDDLIYVAPKK
jgi:peptidoglycan-associated lipoprotein